MWSFFGFQIVYTSLASGYPPMVVETCCKHIDTHGDGCLQLPPDIDTTQVQYMSESDQHQQIQCTLKPIQIQIRQNLFRNPTNNTESDWIMGMGMLHEIVNLKKKLHIPTKGTISGYV